MAIRVTSPLFPSDLPTRVFRAETKKDVGGIFRAFVSCTHLDRRGLPIYVVVCKKAGTWSSRSTARRKALDALSYILVGYPSDSCTEE